MRVSKSNRLITGAFGMLFVVLAVLTVVSVAPEIRWRGVAVGLVLGFLGVDAIVASVRGTSSLISLVGPLP
jgi:heme A synthase